MEKVEEETTGRELADQGSHRKRQRPLGHRLPQPAFGIELQI